MEEYKKILEYENLSPKQFFEKFVTAQLPIVIRGFANNWPIVNAAKKTPQDFVSYLLSFYTDQKVDITLGHPSINGRFFYTDDMKGFNFIRGNERFDLFLERLLELINKDVYPGLCVQGIAVSKILPGLANKNSSDFFLDVEPLLWLGNQITVAAHFDYADNLACVVAGSRKFVLFSPDQVANLYPGSLTFNPAGVPVSLVNLHAPDFDRYPRFKVALDSAYSAVLHPGDAIFIPMLWWHHVESLDKVSGLMNYWWNGSAAKDVIQPTPVDCLSLALSAMGKLTPIQRKAFQALFDHYLFK